MDLAKKKWEFSWEMAEEVPGQRQVMVALMATTRCPLCRAPELSGCFAAAELGFRPLWWALQSSHLLHTDRPTEFQTVSLLLGPSRLVGESNFSGFISWGCQQWETVLTLPSFIFLRALQIFFDSLLFFPHHFI